MREALSSSDSITGEATLAVRRQARSAGLEPIHGPACLVQCSADMVNFAESRVFRGLPPRGGTLAGENLDHV